ncbi:MAG TPA: hypothetical protein VKE23_07975 [Candidatus Limnocylindria bacterium]|nr:hypothetical protein [Candidatus Limnocylindria bacterium]
MLIGADVPVDTRSMEEAGLDDLREELAVLEDEEKRKSAERRHLHRQMDFGFATETTHAREREVSSHRRELHRRIDALRERLGLPVGPQRPSPETSLQDMTDRGLIQRLERIGDRAPGEAAVAEPGHLLGE